MTWQIEFDPLAAKELDSLDPQHAKRILKFLFQRIHTCENPRELGQALKGSKLGDLWKYRVGDYRIICSIEDSKLTIYVVKIGNRRDVYR